jgi:hypothetical protein
LDKLVRDTPKFAKALLEWVDGGAEQGSRRFPNVDIDGDGIIDPVEIWYSGSLSLMPADPCRLAAKLQSGRIVRSEEICQLIYFDSKVYALGPEVDPNGLTGRRHAYRVTESGVTRLCSGIGEFEK